MKIEITEAQNEVRVLLEGRLDTAAAVEVAADFKSLSEKADKAIVLDCSQLEYISSSGLRLFIGPRKDSAAKGGKVIVERMNDDIRNVFTMTGFLSLFEIRD